jgi:hypothetical protein
MPDAPRVHVSAMEGKGAYNRNAAIPASGGAFAIPLLEKAAQQISLNSDDRPIVIADYGSSQGKNSLAPTRSAIATLRMRAGRQRPIFVCHTDLPANDFSEMFALLESDAESYLQGEPQVFPYAIGRSFIGGCSRPVTSISGGVPTPPSGSPDSCADPGPLLHSLLDGLGSGRVRSPGGTRLGIIPDPTGSRAAGGRPFGCRAARARSRWNGRVRFDDEPRERRTL